MDNCSIYLVAGITEIIEVGAIAHFIPPYSSDLNLAFSKVKAIIKEFDNVTLILMVT